MTVMYESFFGEATGSLLFIDEFAEVRGTRGPTPAPIPPLRFALIAREEAMVMTPLTEPIELKARSGASGAYIFINEGRTPNEPWQRLAAGRYRLAIEGDYYQPLQVDIDWPLQPAAMPAISLRPGYNYPYPDVTLPSERITLLRGSVLTGVSGEPVENATVEITNPAGLGPFVSALTDANGAWALAFRHANLNPFDATVTITTPGNPPVDVLLVPIQPGSDNSLAHTALRGTVLGVSGRPIRDAEVSVDIVPNEFVRSDRDGRWHFYFDINQPDAMGVQVTAAAPNGQNQTINADVFNRATGVVPTFRIAMN